VRCDTYVDPDLAGECILPHYKGHQPHACTPLTGCARHPGHQERIYKAKDRGDDNTLELIVAPLEEYHLPREWGYTCSRGCADGPTSRPSKFPRLSLQPASPSAAASVPSWVDVEREVMLRKFLLERDGRATIKYDATYSMYRESPGSPAPHSSHFKPLSFAYLIRYSTEQEGGGV
jgi:hypothetical protein